MAPVEQTDLYFNHPGRDFRKTNEAFRIRSAGEDNCLTYKGPLLDTATKMRNEIEIPIASGAATASQMAEMLTALGFRSVQAVRKVRTAWMLTFEGQVFDVALDQVPGIGQFLELELLVEEADRDGARVAILELANHLKLGQPERQSYLELVIANSTD